MYSHKQRAASLELELLPAQLAVPLACRRQGEGGSFQSWQSDNQGRAGCNPHAHNQKPSSKLPFQAIAGHPARACATHPWAGSLL